MRSAARRNVVVLRAVAAEWLRDVAMLQAECRRWQKKSQEADKCHESVERFFSSRYG